jgi:hypothetical protein
MSLVAEALQGVRGAARIVGRDPDAFDDFNVTADGFWRSFAAILPTALLAWPFFVSNYRIAVETAQADGKAVPDFSLAHDYAYLCLLFAIWPVASAFLAKALGVARNYSRYLIAYNWMSVPAMALSLIPHLFYLSGLIGWQGMILPSIVMFFGLAYLSWYVALRGLETTPLIAFAFLVADYGLSFALDALIR